MSQIVIRNPGTPINQIYCKVYDFHWNFHSEIGEELFEEILKLPYNPFDHILVLKFFVSLGS